MLAAVGRRFDRKLLVGAPDLPARKLRRRSRLLTIAVVVLANTVGGAVVLCRVAVDSASAELAY